MGSERRQARADLYRRAGIALIAAAAVVLIAAAAQLVGGDGWQSGRSYRDTLPDLAVGAAAGLAVAAAGVIVARGLGWAMPWGSIVPLAVVVMSIAALAAAGDRPPATVAGPRPTADLLQIPDRPDNVEQQEEPPVTTTTLPDGEAESNDAGTNKWAIAGGVGFALAVFGLMALFGTTEDGPRLRFKLVEEPDLLVPIDPEVAALAFERSSRLARDIADPAAAIRAAYQNMLDAFADVERPRLAHEAPFEHLLRALRGLVVERGPLEELADLAVAATFSSAVFAPADRERAIELLDTAAHQLRRGISIQALDG